MTTATRAALDPGLHYISMRDYLLDPALGSSFLRDMAAKCPAYAHARNLASMIELEEGTAKWGVLERGTAIHTLSLEPDLFADAYAVVDGNRNSTAVKTEIAAWNAKGRVVVKSTQLYEVEAVAAAVRGNAQMLKIISRATHKEVTCVWDDDLTGIRCKARLDVADEDGNALYDLKTTRNAEPEAWSRALLTYGYHMQAAHHLTGARACGLDVSRFGFLVVESSSPYLTRIGTELDPDSLAVGQAEIEAQMGIYAECMRTGNWPGYESGYDRLPEWAIKRAQQGAGVDFSGIELESDQ